MATSSTSLPAKVIRRLRRIAGNARRKVRRSTAVGQRLVVTVDPRRVETAAASLTPWATRRPLTILGAGPATIRALATTVSAEATTLDLEVTLQLPNRWPRPRGLVRLALPDVRHLSITDHGRTVTVALRTAKEIPLATALWAIGSILTPATLPHADGSADVHLSRSGQPELSAFGVGAWLQVGPYGKSDAADVEAESAITLPAATPDRPVVDISVVNPIGIDLARMQDRTIGSASLRDGTLVLNEGATASTKTLNELLSYELFEESAVRSTRWLAGAHLTIADTTEADDARAHARRVAELAATGLVVVANDIPSAVADLIDPELLAIVKEPMPTSTQDGWRDRLAWQARSARQRRAALRGHGAPLVLGRHVGRSALPTVSVLLVTNRPDMVADAVNTVARQTYERLEVIVGLHGQSVDSLPQAARDALAAMPHESTVVPIDADRTLGEALTLCTEAASGTLLVKMDDDDRYGPEHVWDLVIAKLYSGADLVGKAPEITELQASQQVVLRSFPEEEVWGAYVIGATMLVARGPLLEVGGWRPTPWAVDKALLDRFGQRGRNVYRAQNLGWAYVRRGSGHTWEQDDAYFRGQAKEVWAGDAMADVLDLVVNQA